MSTMAIEASRACRSYLLELFSFPRRMDFFPSYASYVLTWHRALPLKAIIVGQSPYNRDFFPRIASAFSYDDGKTRREPNGGIPVSVAVLANDAHIVADVPFEDAVEVLRDSWVLVDDGVLLVDEKVSSNIYPSAEPEIGKQIDLLVELLRFSRDLGSQNIALFAIGRCGEDVCAQIKSRITYMGIEADYNSSFHPGYIVRNLNIPYGDPVDSRCTLRNPPFTLALWEALLGGGQRPGPVFQLASKERQHLAKREQAENEDLMFAAIVDDIREMSTTVIALSVRLVELATRVVAVQLAVKEREPNAVDSWNDLVAAIEAVSLEMDQATKAMAIVRFRSNAMAGTTLEGLEQAVMENVPIAVDELNDLLNSQAAFKLAENAMTIVSHRTNSLAYVLRKKKDITAGLSGQVPPLKLVRYSVRPTKEELAKPEDGKTEEDNKIRQMRPEELESLWRLKVKIRRLIRRGDKSPGASNIMDEIEKLYDSTSEYREADVSAPLLRAVKYGAQQLYAGKDWTPDEELMALTIGTD